MARRTVTGAIVGVARVDRRTKQLVKRLGPGDIAIIDHEDLDRIAAESIVEARPAAVVNAAKSMSGRYPNVGPLLVAAAGIPLVDGAGPNVMGAIVDGAVVRVVGDAVLIGDAVVASGTRQDLQSLEAAFEEAKQAIGVELERFAENTLEYMRQERHLLVEAPNLPPVRTPMRGRHALIVVRGRDYRDDLAALRPTYIPEVRPALIAVDGGADALLEAGLRPDMIIGDFDSVSEQALRCGAELIVHAYAGGEAPGAARLDALGLAYERFESAGTSEDIAMLLAHELGAELIVAVGTHASMVDFLDKGRAGMASTFLTRMRVGQILVDAKGVSRLYSGQIRKRDLTLFLAAALLSFVVAVFVFVPQVFLDSMWLIVRDLWRSATR